MYIAEKFPCITVNCLEPTFQSWENNVPVDKGGCYFSVIDVESGSLPTFLGISTLPKCDLNLSSLHIFLYY